MAKLDKFVIGLTGNIATGKSVVRKMLEHLGAYGIDADQLAHRVIAKGAPGYQPVVDEFGKFVLAEDGQIDRAKLGKLVFSDSEALAKLEEIVHPEVRKAVDHLINNATQNVVVVEAIKLLESPLKDKLNSIWVTSASEKIQLARLVEKKKMSEADARQRMDVQSSQEEKITTADVVIENDGGFEDAWKQVQDNWNKLFGASEDAEPVKIQLKASQTPATSIDSSNLGVLKATPKHAEDIANLINRLSGGTTDLSRIDIMAAFGEKAFMILLSGEQMVGVAGWQVENLVAKVDEVWFEDGLDTGAGLGVVLGEVEEASKVLQAEASLVFVSPVLADHEIWIKMGYEKRDPGSLNVSAWREAVGELEGKVLMFKQLRVDRVLKPI